jgi:hypothetical protein
MRSNCLCLHLSSSCSILLLITLVKPLTRASRCCSAFAALLCAHIGSPETLDPAETRVGVSGPRNQRTHSTLLRSTCAVCSTLRTMIVLQGGYCTNHVQNPYHERSSKPAGWQSPAGGTNSSKTCSFSSPRYVLALIQAQSTPACVEI